MKAIAFYLPQFHTFPENDEWWGKGFTEWTNVKKSKSLFKGHNRPEVPLNNNYYDLSKIENMIEQAKLAKKYGLYGFCYYHYWFEGKLLLEKPLENMLCEKSVDIPFCMCWANESWARTWDGQETNILIKQNYNDSEEGWKKHFEYLLKFFKDDRYIKINNKPMFIVYKPYLIKKYKQMLDFWNKLSMEHGFEGMYFGYQYPDSLKYDDIQDEFDFGIEFEPTLTFGQIMEGKEGLSLFKKINYLHKIPNGLKNTLKTKLSMQPYIVDYDYVWEKILSRKPLNNKIFPGAFCSWDNTPRKGKSGLVFYEATPEKFKEYLARQFKRAKEDYNVDFIFINAWNEWGEGAHLEPDIYNGYGYLEALKNAVDMMGNRN